jgi:hypothetical protein
MDCMFGLCELLGSGPEPAPQGMAGATREGDGKGNEGQYVVDAAAGSRLTQEAPQAPIGKASTILP